MKKSFYNVVFSIAAILSVFLSCFVSAVNINSSDSELADNMIGDWNCEYTISLDGLDIIGKSSEAFIDNGKAFSDNLITINFSGESPNQVLAGRSLQLSISEAYEWQIRDKKFIRNAGTTTLNAVSDPELAELLEVDKWDLSGDAETADFVEVSNRQIKFSVKSDKENEFVTCQRQENII